MKQLLLDIDPDEFQEEFLRNALDSGTAPILDVVAELVVALIERNLEHLLRQGTLLRSRVKWIRPPFRPHGPPHPLAQITSHANLDLGYFTISLAVPKSASSLQFGSPTTLRFLEPPRFKRSVLKTIVCETIHLRSVAIPTRLLNMGGQLTCADTSCPSDSLIPYIEGVWDWGLRFICKFCGRSYFCECFRAALDKRLADAKAQSPRYSPSGWPHRFIQAYSQSSFRPGICHLCSDSPSDLFFCHPMYGSKVLVHYGPYIYKFAAEEGISNAEAENRVRDILGIPRIGEGWLSEAELLRMVRVTLKDQRVLHQASPPWLGRQRLDIFLPDLGVAIEYQGRQHYEPVPFFGGETGYQETIARDQRKARVCAERGISLVYFRYDEEITPELVRERIDQARPYGP